MPDINDVFNYVMESPDNTNPNVLRSMLNSLEGGGSGGGAFIVQLDMSTWTLDKTFKEIAEASMTMPVVIFIGSSGFAMQQPFLALMSGDGQYAVASLGVDDVTGELMIYSYVTTNADGYPVLQHSETPETPGTPVQN